MLIIVSVVIIIIIILILKDSILEKERVDWIIFNY